MNLAKPLQQGFTLLELIVVVGLLGLMTSLTTDYLLNETNQQRYNTTQQRLAQIRYAIIGDTSRNLNGQPTVSGFVADTGKLPTSIKALLTYPKECQDPTYSDEQSCLNAGKVWRYQDNWQGPYLVATTWRNGEPVFADAWGNTDASANFGWHYVAVLGDDIVISSHGLNHQAGGNQPYEAEQKIVIGRNEYAGGEPTVIIEDISLQNHTGTLLENLCLIITAPSQSPLYLDVQTANKTLPYMKVFGWVSLTTRERKSSVATCQDVTSSNDFTPPKQGEPAFVTLPSRVFLHNRFPLTQEIKVNIR